MRVYRVEYKRNDWASDVNTVLIVASSVVKAATEAGKRRYVNYSGYVVNVTEIHSSVHIAK
jgi:hypothetical protein